MKSPFPLFVFLVVAALSPYAEASSDEHPQELAPYVVNESPFGFLGVKHATIGINPFKMIVGMNSVKLLQIDELDPSSPGIAAGVKAGDRIISIDGIQITKFGVQKLRRMGEEVVVGQKIVVEVMRPSDGSTRTMVVVVSTKPKTAN
jgi:membrane-associated protease RseP (regulator of RpoE activity)